MCGHFVHTVVRIEHVVIWNSSTPTCGSFQAVNKMQSHTIIQYIWLYEPSSPITFGHRHIHALYWTSAFIDPCLIAYLPLCDYYSAVIGDYYTAVIVTITLLLLRHYALSIACLKHLTVKYGLVLWCPRGKWKLFDSSTDGARLVN